MCNYILFFKLQSAFQHIPLKFHLFKKPIIPTFVEISLKTHSMLIIPPSFVA